MSNPYDPPNPDEPTGPPRYPASQPPPGATPPGQAPSGQAPSGQAPPGYPGQAPAYPGQQGQYPQGQHPPQGQYPQRQYPPGQYGAPQRPPSERKGLAITSLVLGILAVLGCWIPILNIGAILLGVAGLVLGIVALVQVSKGTAGGQAMAIIGAALSTLAIIAAIVINVFFVTYLENQGPTFQDEIEQQLEELENQGY